MVKRERINIEMPDEACIDDYRHLLFVAMGGMSERKQEEFKKFMLDSCGVGWKLDDVPGMEGKRSRSYLKHVKQ